MTVAIDKMGGAASRWSSSLFDCVRDAVEHGITPRELILEIEVCWALVLHDAKKDAAKEFTSLLAR